jgi:hypothetical protein
MTMALQKPLVEQSRAPRSHLSVIYAAQKPRRM